MRYVWADICAHLHIMQIRYAHCIIFKTCMLKKKGYNEYKYVKQSAVYFDPQIVNVINFGGNKNERFSN